MTNQYIEQISEATKKTKATSVTNNRSDIYSKAVTNPIRPWKLPNVQTGQHPPRLPFNDLLKLWWALTSLQWTHDFKVLHKNWFLIPLNLSIMDIIFFLVLPLDGDIKIFCTCSFVRISNTTHKSSYQTRTFRIRIGITPFWK